MYATKETLEEAEESRKKMKGKMIATNYTKINQLYKTFIPKKAPSDEQRYFSKASTYNVTPTPKPPLREMLKSVRLWRNIKTLETQIKGRKAYLLEGKQISSVGLTGVKIDEDSRPGSGDAIWKFQTASGLKWDAIWIMETASGSAVKFEDPKKP
ncbi:hypothetical protein Tco_0967864 [Tanacetum coccineum]